MAPVSYMILLETTEETVELMLTVLNTAGMGHVYYSQKDTSGGKELWIIPIGKKNRQEVNSKLQAVPAICNASVVELSKPVKEIELAEVRKLFAELGWDASEVTTEELSLFVNDKLSGKDLYFIDDKQELTQGSVKIRIRPIEEHPHFSPDWLTNSNPEEEQLDRELTVDDVVSVTVQSQRVELPPSRPKPNNQQQLSSE